MRTLLTTVLVILLLAFSYQVFYVVGYLAGAFDNQTMFIINLIFGIVNVFNFAFYIPMTIRAYEDAR